MGVYSEYLDRSADFDIVAERKCQLKRISDYRGRDVLVYASDSNKGRQMPVALDASDILPIVDQISNLKGNAIDVILLTGGGSAEAAEDIVRILYSKYRSVAFIVPGMAKSAGTIMVMGGDEILMEPSSSLGPIDAQIIWEGKIFSAEAFLKGLEKIKEDAKTSLNRAYVPILQRISPGEIQSANNALEFAKVLVTQWLKEHKFKNWKTHRTHSPGVIVTEEEREIKAKEIADKLCNHSSWLSHGRSIKISDLEELGLEITDYSQHAELADAIRRYYALLQISFDQSSIYKIYETIGSQIHKAMAQELVALPSMVPQIPTVPNGSSPVHPTNIPTGVIVNFKCPNCGMNHALQADFEFEKPLQANLMRYPSNDVLTCQKCRTVHVLSAIRKQIEGQTKRRIVR
jgi:hypothetical protein